MKIFWNFFLYLVLIAWTFAANAQIKGQVFDQQSKEPIAGASVSIENTSQGTSTDLNGFF